VTLLTGFLGSGKTTLLRTRCVARVCRYRRRHHEIGEIAMTITSSIFVEGSVLELPAAVCAAP